MSIIESQENYQLRYYGNNTNPLLNASIVLLFAFMTLSITGCTGPSDINFDSNETSGISEASETPEMPEMIVIIVHEPMHPGPDMPAIPFMGPTGMFEMYSEGFGHVYNNRPMPFPTTNMEAQQYLNELFGN